MTVVPDSDVLPIQTVYASSGWDSYSWAFEARHGAATLIVHNPGVSEDPACGPLLDSFAIKASRISGRLLCLPKVKDPGAICLV